MFWFYQTALAFEEWEIESIKLIEGDQIIQKVSMAADISISVLIVKHYTATCM